MKISVNTDDKTISYESNGQQKTAPLYSKQGFEVLSDLWVKVGWDQKYSYTFSWMGRPIIQLPEDMVRTQEVIYRVQPDVIIETGVAHGGSLIYYASLCKALDKGRVIGVDIEIRKHNREAIESHALSSYITLIEGDSAGDSVVQSVRGLVNEGETVLIILDSCHSYAHVLRELEAYHSLVTEGSYIVATDGLMKDVWDVPRGTPDWKTDNPVTAVHEFLASHPEFRLEQPSWPFNESELSENITHWPQAWLRRC
ncbi:MAG: cephalosporin hydroxylase family protein [Planctomycetaceae bacterium]|nr:cephalosporin hydroxylase family protein [Planctomycetaceae bacterium]